MLSELKKAAEMVYTDYRTLARWIRSGRCYYGVYIPCDDKPGYGYYYIDWQRLEAHVNGRGMEYKGLYGSLPPNIITIPGGRQPLKIN